MNTFVLSDTEVRLTGRTASRIAMGKNMVLVEVTPADEDSGTWKKWVPRASLFEIQQLPETAGNK